MSPLDVEMIAVAVLIGLLICGPALVSLFRYTRMIKREHKKKRLIL